MCIRGSHCSFCSSEPQRQIANIASDPCTETTLRIPESPASSSDAREPVGDGARAREAVAVEVHPEEAELRELPDHLARQHAALEPVADLGHDLLADELAHGVADRPLLVVEERVDREEVERVERCGLLGRRGGHGNLRVVDGYRTSGWTTAAVAAPASVEARDCDVECRGRR